MEGMSGQGILYVRVERASLIEIEIALRTETRTQRVLDERCIRKYLGGGGSEMMDTLFLFGRLY